MDQRFPSTGTAKKNPYILDDNDLSKVKSAPAKTDQQPAAKPNPYVLGEEDLKNIKKKDGGSESSHTPSISASPSDEGINAAVKNFNNKQLTVGDANVLASIDNGNQYGLKSLTPEQRQVFVQAHNGPKMSELYERTYGILDTAIPKSDNPQINSSRGQLISAVKAGDQKAIKSAKEYITTGINKQIDEIKKQAINSIPISVSPLGLAPVGQAPQLSNEQTKKIDNLKKQAEEIEGTLNEYAVNAATDSKENQAQIRTEVSGKQYSFIPNIAAEDIGKQVEKIYGRTPNPNGNITYERQKVGLASIIENKHKKINDLITQGLKNKNQTLLNQAGKEAQELTQYQHWADNLIDQFPDVAITQTARFIGDEIAETHPRSMIISKSDVEESAKRIEEKYPGFMNRFGKYVGVVAESEGSGLGALKSGMVPKGGITGGLETGLAQWGYGGAATIAGIFGNERVQAEAEKSQDQPSLKGTKFSGEVPTKVVYDDKGKAYREKSNEDYGKINFNSSTRFIGESIPGLAQWVSAEAATGGLAGLAGAGKAAQAAIGLVGASYITSYDANHKLADNLIDDNSSQGEAKKNAVANFLTLSTAGVFHMIGYSPTKFVENAVTKSVASDVVKMFEEGGYKNLTKKQTESFIRDVLIPKAKTFAVESGRAIREAGKAGAATVADQKIKDFTSQVINPEKANPSTIDDNIKTFIQQTLFMGMLGLPKAVVSGITSPTMKDALWEAGSRAPQHIEEINRRAASGEYTPEQANQLIAAVKTMGEEVAKSETQTTKDGMPLTLQQKRDIAVANFRKRAAEKMKESGSDISTEKVKGDADEQIKNIKSNNTHLPLEETHAFKTAKEIGEEGKEGKKIASFEDIDPSKKYTWQDDAGSEKEGTGLELLSKLPNSKEYEKPETKTSEGDDTKSEKTKGAASESKDAKSELPEEKVTRESVVEEFKKVDLSKQGSIKDAFKDNPEGLLNFIQEQATGLTEGREAVGDHPAYQQAVEMVGEDLVRKALEIIPDNEKKLVTDKFKTLDADGVDQVMDILSPKTDKNGNSESKVEAQGEGVRKANSETGQEIPQGHGKEVRPKGDDVKTEGVAETEATPSIPYKPNIRDDYFAKADFFTPEEKEKFKTLDETGQDKMIDDKRNELKNAGTEPTTEAATAGNKESVVSPVEDKGIAEKTRQEQESIPKDAVQIDSATKPFAAAEALRGSAERLRAEGDEEGAAKLEAEANRLQSGGEPPVEGAITEDEQKPGATGVKKAVIESERDLSGKTKIENQLRRDFPQVIESARKIIKNNPRYTETLKNLIDKTLRPLTAEETVALSLRKAELQKDAKNVSNDILDAIKNGDAGAETEARIQLDAIQVERDNIDRIATKTNYEKGLSLAVNKILIQEDFSAEALIRKAKAKTADGEITAKQEAKLKELSEKLEDVQRRLEEHQEKISQLEAQKKVADIVGEENKKGKIKAKKEKIAAERKSLIEQFKKEWKGGDSDAKRQGIPLTDKMVAIIAKLARNYVEDGIVTLQEIVGNIVNDLKEHAEGISDKDVRDAISGYGQPTKNTFSEISNQMKDLRKQAELVSKIEDVNAGRGVYKKEKSRTTPSEAVLKLKENLRDAMTAAGIDPYQEKALKSYKTRLKNIKANLMEQLATGNYAKEERKKITPDKELFKLQSEIEDLKKQVSREMYKIEQESRPVWQKRMDWFVKWRRAVLLSSVSTLGKLASAATERSIITPMEELAGSFLRIIPGYSHLAKMAPREGGIIALDAEKAAAAVFKNKETWDQMRKAAKEGVTDLDLMYGKDAKLSTEWLDAFGNIHMALKTPAKYNEFYRSLQKRVDYAYTHGFDPMEPVTNQTIRTQAYMDAQRAIFMQDNLLTDGYRQMTNYFDKQGGAGKVTAAVLRTLLPIVKVPTNFVWESSSYAFGAVKALPYVAKAILKGVESLTPDQADFVIRAMKKQSLGAGILALGYFNPQSVGGYYQQYEKRKEGDLKAGDVELFGTHLPHFILHAPLIEMLQVGSTLRRVQDKYQEKGKEGGTVAGLIGSGKGLFGQVPFFNQAGTITRAIQSQTGVTNFAADFIKSLVIPPTVQQIATEKDTDEQGNKIQRKPTGFVERLETGIPGLREKVPTKEEVSERKKAEREEQKRIKEEQEQNQ